MLSTKDNDLGLKIDVAPRELPPSGELLIGELVTLDELGQAVVEFQYKGFEYRCSALATVDINMNRVGRAVALSFVCQQEINQVVILGYIHNPLELALAAHDQLDLTPASSTSDANPQFKLDGDKLVIDVEKEIVFKAGDASLSLRPDGKISLRGKYILKRATKTNRILGGSVQIN